MKKLSPRQAKKRRIAQRKMRELAWLAEHPELFNVPGATVKLLDWGTTIGIELELPSGKRNAVAAHYTALTKGVDKLGLARRMGMGLKGWAYREMSKERLVAKIGEVLDALKWEALNAHALHRGDQWGPGSGKTRKGVDKR